MIKNPLALVLSAAVLLAAAGGCGGGAKANPGAGPGLVRIDVPPGIVVRRACTPTAPEPILAVPI